LADGRCRPHFELIPRYRQETVKPVNAAIATFFLTAVIGCLAIAFGYIAYADSTHTFDRECATGMAVLFFYAPLGGVIMGVACAVATFKIPSRRTPDMM
jgi:hypothetical protein